MGTGGSKELELGVPANPRVNYADELSKKQKRVGWSSFTYSRHKIVMLWYISSILSTYNI